MRTLIITQRVFCPFRILVGDFQAGCVAQMGKDSLCFSQDARPLLPQNNHFFCPLTNIRISNEIHQHLERILAPLLEIQDEENTGISVWPLLSSNSFIWKQRAITEEGKEMEEQIKKLREILEEIIFNLY
ncbi:MAG: hypothetical protein JSW11_11255 [Candidatus Heimdallarchaeota archaeon]|nr:MAG: hypothetical protein JSW11_11255 [Candidatus Heimdallarchaeota archaeon]